MNDLVTLDSLIGHRRARGNTSRSWPSLFAALAPAVAAMFAIAPAGAQCGTPGGNAVLTLNGQPALGNDLRVAITASPQVPLWLAMDTNGGPVVVPGLGTICLGPSPLFIAGGGAPLTLVPNSGQWQMDLSIPQIPSLVGATFFLQGVVFDVNSNVGKILLTNGASMTIQPQPSYQTVFFDGFEATPPQGPWTASNGLWSIDTPTVGPTPYAGIRCAATNPHGNYGAAGEDSTWRSPIIALPTVTSSQRLLLRYRVWFESEDVWDYMQPRILANPLSPGSSFQNLPGTRAMSGSSGAWVLAGADLTPYAGQLVQIGFRFVSQTYGPPVAGPGFYLDDVLVAVCAAPTLGLQQNWDAPQGVGLEWTVDNGLWEVGTPPTSNLVQPHSGQGVAATLLATNYPAAGADTRLVSPRFVVPTNPIVPQLYFWHSVQCEPVQDFGKVQYSSNGGITWNDLGGPYSGWGNGAWTLSSVFLVDSNSVSLAGQEIQIAFTFVSQNYGPAIAGAGWFIDDIQVF